MLFHQASIIFTSLALAVPFVEDCHIDVPHRVDLDEPNFGPDNDQPLDLGETVTVNVPGDGRAKFTFTADADNENAIVIYDGKTFDELHIVDNFDLPLADWTFENNSYHPRTLVVSGWHKDGPPDPELPWIQSEVQVETQTPHFVAAGFEDDGDADFNDIAFEATIYE